MNLILDALFPKRCLGCGKNGSYLCRECTVNIMQADLVCPQCERLAVGGQTHPVCRRRYALDGLWSLGVYQDPLKKVIQKLKYRGVEELSTLLTELVLDYWARYQPYLLDEIKRNPGNWVVVPVPLYWFRENKRGFNQASLIGQDLAKRMGLGFQEALKRIRYTKQQAKLKGAERHQNIKNAFAIIENFKFKIENSNILLVDDVWTTGSTLRECCYILKRNSAKKVWALTLAR